MMRVLLVGENHRAEIRGRTVAIHGLATALRDRGHDVTLVQAARKEHRVSLEGVRMRYIATTRKSRYPLLLGGLSTRSYDVVHTNDESGAYLALRSRVQRIPLVAQIQPPRMRHEPFWKANWRWRYIGIAARHAPVVLCPSRWLGDQVTERFELDPAKVHAIEYGLNDAWFDAHRPPDSQAGGPVRVALVNMKGVDVALRAFAKVAEPGEARLELYGVDKYLEEHRRLAGELGIASRVRFEGFIPNAQLMARVAGADMLIHPARSEGFGQVLAEAAALGIPAIASYVGAIPDVVIEGETGLLCPVDDVDAFSDAMSKLFSEPELRGRLGAAARERAEHRWRWDRAAARIEREVYARVQRTPSPSASP